jgi:hypothetical protein
MMERISASSWRYDPDRLDQGMMQPIIHLFLISWSLHGKAMRIGRRDSADRGADPLAQPKRTQRSSCAAFPNNVRAAYGDFGVFRHRN